MHRGNWWMWSFLFNLFTISMAWIDSTSNFTLSAFMSVHVPQIYRIEQIVELNSARVIQMRKDLIGAGDGVVDFLQLIPSRSPVISCLLSSSVVSLQTGLRFCTHIVSLWPLFSRNSLDSPCELPSFLIFYSNRARLVFTTLPCLYSE